MRSMIWVKSALMAGWACSECDWAFDDSGPPQGDSIDEMVRNFECARDKEFASHICTLHPRGTTGDRGTKGKKR